MMSLAFDSDKIKKPSPVGRRKSKPRQACRKGLINHAGLWFDVENLFKWNVYCDSFMEGSLLAPRSIVVKSV